MKGGEGKEILFYFELEGPRRCSRKYKRRIRLLKKPDDLKNIIDTDLDKLDLSSESKLRVKNKGNLKRISFISIPAAVAVIAIIMIFTNIFSNGQLKVYASDLMKNITPHKVEPVELKEPFINSTADFSLELFKKSYTKGKNSLVSPTSVLLALGMTANGADGNTLRQFETVLGNRGISISDLNLYYNSLGKNLTNTAFGKVSIANSIWYSKDKNINVKQSFLQTNADYYNAAAYKADFNSNATVKDINNWVKNNTGSLIERIIDKIDPNTFMFLINTVYFEEKWLMPYAEGDVRKDSFELMDGSKKTVNFMHSEESGYLKDDKAEGFIKSYKGKYSFVALLPNKNIGIDNYVASLSGESFIKLLKNRSKDKVYAGLPKFKSAYEIKLVEPLKRMGLTDCFSNKADFSKMADSGIGDIYIGDVLHKTFITVDTEGTKAGAVTKVEMKTQGIESNVHTINLNRPFVYAIVDNDTNLPLFIGTMVNPEI